MRISFAKFQNEPFARNQTAADTTLIFSDLSRVHVGSKSIYAGRDLNAKETSEFNKTLAGAFMRATARVEPSVICLKDGYAERANAHKPVQIANSIVAAVLEMELTGDLPYGFGEENGVHIQASTRSLACDIAEAVLKVAPRTKLIGEPQRPAALSAQLKTRFTAWAKSHAQRPTINNQVGA